MTTRLRLPAGAAALAAGLWFLTSAAAAPVLPKESYQKVAATDITTLQKFIEICASDPKEARRYGPTARAQAMMLAMYAEASGDTALRDDALKVAEALGKKNNWKDAGALAGKLAAKPGNAPLKGGDLHKKHNFALDEVMSPFRGGTVGGMNIEKDIRALRDGKAPVKPEAVELLAVRTAVLMEYTAHMPNDKAAGKKAEQWTKLSKDAAELSKKLAEEAAKGKGANEKEIVKMVKALDAKCLDCHKEFRDD